MERKLCVQGVVPHRHHLVPGALVSQLPEAADKALAGLTVRSACIQHGLALFHQLKDTDKEKQTRS